MVEHADINDFAVEVRAESDDPEMHERIGNANPSPSSPSNLPLSSEGASAFPVQIEKIADECVDHCGGPSKMLYKLWPGRNRFFFKGLLMTGGENDIPFCPSPSLPNLCTWCCILIPSILYFFVAVGPMWKVHAALPMVTGLVFIITTICLIGACMTDPGVFPRRDVVLATKTREKLRDCLGYDLLGNTGNGRLRRDLTEEEINRILPKHLIDLGYRWCSTCQIVRPPRSSHCRYCDNCVLRFDHHCPFVNNCIGQRNYVFFFGFISCVWLLALLVLPSLGYVFLRSNEDEGTGGWNQYIIPIVVVLSLILLVAIAVLGFWIYHSFLSLTGQTTKEHLTGKKVENVDQDPTLCAARGPRLFNLQAMVIEGEFLWKKRPLWGRNKRRSGDEYYATPTVNSLV